MKIKGDDGKCAYCPECDKPATATKWNGKFASCPECGSELVLRKRT